MLNANSVNQCNEFVRTMNELSPHWFFKIVRFNDELAIGTVKGYILEKNLLKEDDEVVLNAVMGIKITGDNEFEIYLLESDNPSAPVQKLKSTYRSGFEAAGAVAASVALRKDRELFFDDTGQSLAKSLGFL